MWSTSKKSPYCASVDQEDALEYLTMRKRLCFEEREEENAGIAASRRPTERSALAAIENDMEKMDLSDSCRVQRRNALFTSGKSNSAGSESTNSSQLSEVEDGPNLGTPVKSATDSIPKPGTPEMPNNAYNKRLSVDLIIDTPMKAQRFRPRTSFTVGGEEAWKSGGSSPSGERGSAPWKRGSDCLEEVVAEL